MPEYQFLAAVDGCSSIVFTTASAACTTCSLGMKTSVDSWARQTPQGEDIQTAARVLPCGRTTWETDAQTMSSGLVDRIVNGGDFKQRESITDPSDLKEDIIVKTSNEHFVVGDSTLRPVKLSDLQLAVDQVLQAGAG